MKDPRIPVQTTIHNFDLCLAKEVASRLNAELYEVNGEFVSNIHDLAKNDYLGETVVATIYVLPEKEAYVFKEIRNIVEHRNETLLTLLDIFFQEREPGEYIKAALTCRTLLTNALEHDQTATQKHARRAVRKALRNLCDHDTPDISSIHEIQNLIERYKWFL